MDPLQNPMNTVDVRTYLSRRSVLLNAHQGEALSQADLAVIFQLTAAVHFARGSLHGTAVSDIEKILERSPSAIPPGVKHAIADRFQRFQEDVLRGVEPAALFMEQKRSALLRDLVVDLQRRVDDLKTLIGPTCTPFHHLPPISCTYD